MPTTTLRVLYVDDEPALLDICRLFLARTGTMAVTTADSAAAALALLRDGTYDVVVADYQMPVTDGIALLKTIRAESDIPFILFTGKGREEVVIEALNSGADFYLQKGGDPVAQFTELAHKIRQAVERKRAERALRESERRLHDLIEFLPDATFAIDRAGTVIAWNRAIEELTGVPASEMLGKGDYAYAVPFYGEPRPILVDLVFSDSDETRRHYPVVTKRGDQYISELFIQRLYGGRGAYTWFIASPLYDTQGNLTGAVESIRDVTERKKAEDAQRAAEATISTMFRSSPDIIAISELETGRFLDVNDATERIFGYTRDEMIGKTADELGIWIDPEQRTAMVGMVKKMGRVDRFEAAHRRRNGECFTAAISAGTVMLNGIPYLITTVRDATPLKLAEQALRESEERYRNVVEGQTEFICRFTPAGIHVFVNDAYLRYFGRTRAELVGHRFVPEIPPEDREATRRHFASLTPLHPSATIEHRIIMPDGSIRWQQWSDTAFFDADGKVNEYQSVGRDVTLRRMTEDQLTVSEERYRSLAEASPDLIFVIDRSDHVVYVNSAAARMIGYPPEQVVGMPRDRLFPSQESWRQRENIEKVLSTGETMHTQSAIRMGGRDRLLDHVLVPVHGAGGRITGVLGISRDITEYRIMEQAIRAGERDYRGIIENLQDIFYRADPDGTITMVSPSVVAMTGYGSVQEVIGRNLAKDFYADPSQRIEFLETISRTGSIQNFEAVMKRKDGSTFTVSTSAHLLRDENGAVTGIEGIAKDITDWKRAQEALRESEEKHRTLIERSFDGIAVHQDGTIVFVNPRAVEIFGAASADQIIGREAVSFVHPDSRAVAAARIAAAPSEVQPVIRERFLRLDGNAIDVDVATTPLKWQGRPAVRVVFRDVTERIQKGEALRESEERYRTLIETSPDAILVHQDGRIVYMNPACVALLHATCPGEVIGKGVMEMVHPDFRDAIRSYIERDLAGERTPFIEISLLRCDGTTVSVEAMGVKTRFGDSPAVLVNMRDITSRISAERALSESETNLTSIIRAAPIGIGVVSDRVLMTVNDRLCHMTGYSREELTGQSARILYPTQEEFDYVGREKYAQIARAGTGAVETRFRRKDGTVIEILLSSTPIDPADLKRGVTFTALDITERKRAEAAVVKARDDWEAIFQAIGSPAVIVDPAHRILAANKALLAKAGITAEMAVGMQCWTVFHGKDATAPPENCPLERMLSTCSHEISEMEVQAFGGTYLISCTPIFAPSGALERVIHIATDISALKEAGSALRQKNEELQASHARIAASEEALRKQLEALTVTTRLLRESEQRFSIISSLTSDFAFSCHEQDDGSFAIDWMTGAVGAITGFTIGELKERGCWRCLVLEEDLPFFDAHVIGLAAGSSGTCELRIKAKNGAIVWLSCGARCEADPASPGRRRLYGGCRDISSLKETGTALLRKNEELLASYEQLAASEQEIRRSFDELARLEQQTRALNDSLPDIIYRSDTGGNIVYMNKKGLETFEVTAAEMIDQPFLPNLHPDDIPAGVAVYRRLLETGEPALNFECRFVTRRGKGRAFPVIQNISVVRDEQGAITGTQGIAIDITEKKRYEAALKESEQRLRHILEQIPGTLWTLDTNFTFTSSFGAALKEMGLAADQVVGMSLAQFYEGQPDRDTALAAHKKAFDGEAVSYEARYGDRQYLAHVEPLRDPDGITRGTFGIALDVTDVRRAEMKIRQSEELHRSLVNAIPDGICITSRDGTIAYASPQALQLFGGTMPEEAVGTSVLAWIVPEDRERARADLKRVMEGELPPAAMYRAVRKDGSTVPIEIGVSVIRDVAGGISGMVASIRDISDRIGEQEALRLAHTKLNLLSVVTRHDILNKLMVIEGFLALMKATDDVTLIRQYQEKIQSAATVIRNILAFTRDYQNMGVRAPEWIDLGEVFSRQLSEFDMGTVAVTNGLAGYRVFADPLIEKVMYNLIENALRHGRPLTAITAACVETGEGLVCTVSDDGKGVPAEEKEAIFERGVGSGTGLGLFLAREILAVTGLSIRETGEPGKGARFEIHVPKGRYRAG